MFASLPHELINYVHDYLDGKSLSRLSITSRGLHELAPKDLLRVFANFARVVKEINEIEHYIAKNPDKNASVTLLKDTFRLYVRHEYGGRRLPCYLMIMTPEIEHTIMTTCSTYDSQSHKSLFDFDHVDQFEWDVHNLRQKMCNISIKIALRAYSGNMDAITLYVYRKLVEGAPNLRKKARRILAHMQASSKETFKNPEQKASQL